MSLLTTSELPDLLNYLTPRERAEVDAILTNSPTLYAFGPFEQFAATHLKIQTAKGQVIPFVPKPAQVHLVNHLTGHDLVLKSRQIGISTAIQGLFFQLEMQGHIRTSTLCHDADLTSTFRLMADRFYDELDPELRPEKLFSNAKLTTYHEINSEATIATVGQKAGVKKGRGASVGYIHGSEVAFWPDAEAVLAGAMQGGEPQIILESSPNGAQGWFYELCMEANDEKADSIWTLHFFPWWWEPRYVEPVVEPLEYTDEEQALVNKHGLTPEQIQWRRTKKKELKRLFPQEYPEDPVDCFLQSGNSYFAEVLTDATFSAPDDATPQEGHIYIAGVDWGRQGDWTVCSIFDRTSGVQVALYRWRKMPWGTIRRRLVNACHEWSVHTMVPESNSIGSPNIEALYDMGIKFAIEPFESTNPSKLAAADELYEWFMGGGKLLDDPVQKAEIRAFTAIQTATGAWRLAVPTKKSGPSSGDDDHDDTVLANMMAAYGCKMYRPTGGAWL